MLLQELVVHLFHYRLTISVMCFWFSCEDFDCVCKRLFGLINEKNTRVILLNNIF